MEVDFEPTDDRPPLERFGTNLTEKARQGLLDPVLGREDEILRITNILARRRKNNPVLIGNAGVGKNSIIEKLAQDIADGNVQEQLKDVELYSLQISKLLAGAKYKGDFEERLDQVVDQVRNSNGKVLVFIDEIHTMCNSGKTEGSMDAANLLKPALARGEFSCIGATTYSEYKANIEKDAGLERRFQPVFIEPPTVQETIKILNHIKTKYEEFHGINITTKALESAAVLSERYVTERNLPDKAIDLIDEAMAALKSSRMYQPPAELTEEQKLIWENEASSFRTKVKIQAEIAELEISLEENLDLEEVSEIKYKDIPELKRQLEKVNNLEYKFFKLEVTEEDIAKIITLWTKIPVTSLLKDEKQVLLSMETRLSESVLAQDEAVTKVSNAVRRSRTGLADPKQPKASFMFMGPTGTGKTELSKALTKELFDDEKFLIRLDMSEFAEKHQVNRLTGPPPGYVGYEAGGQLTEAVRRKPYSVILMDEIEKAHTDIYKILLQLLDEGRLTDGQGRTVNFTNCVIIMTTNMTIETMKQRFPPEFINRIGDIIKFKALTQETLRQIFHLQVKKVISKLADMNIQLELPTEVIDFILSKRDEINKDDDESGFGARLIKRNVVRLIEDPVSKKLLEANDIDYICAELVSTKTGTEIVYYAYNKKLVENNNAIY